MERENQRFKILMFPWLAHGHLFPYFELSKRLSQKHNHHFTIYLCSTKVNLNSIKSNDGDALVNLVELEMQSPPNLPPHLHTTKNMPSHLLPTLIATFQQSIPTFSQILDSLKPHLLIYDGFQPWAPNIASSKGIPSVYFSANGASSISYLHHLHTKGTSEPFPFPSLYMHDDAIEKMKSGVRPSIEDEDGDYPWGNYRKSTDIALVKSSRHVEEKYAEYLSVLCKKRIVCTGPLISEGGEHDDFERSEIMRWLNGKGHGSTLYISFGSECFLSKKQIGEIAKGLLLCDVSFLWVIRFPLEERERKIEEELPQGFLETVKERGLVVQGWAPQTKILGHGSIGGFASHCGRSSITESMYFGVPVIALPMNVEQPLNGQLMVELGVGVWVERGENGVYMREELAKAIDKVMVEKAFYEGLRQRARRLSETIKEKEDEEVNEVAKQLLKICAKNTK